MDEQDVQDEFKAVLPWFYPVHPVHPCSKPVLVFQDCAPVIS
jgi:hypothetical protein